MRKESTCQFGYGIHFIVLFFVWVVIGPFSTNVLAYERAVGTAPPMANPHAPLPGPNTPPASGIVGLALHITATKIGEPARLIVRAVHPAGPAGRAGITHGEEIVSVDGHPTTGKTYQEAVSLIRGETGTTVKLGLKGPQGERVISVIRVNESILMKQTPPAL